MKLQKTIDSIVGDALTIFLLATCGIYLLVCIGVDIYMYKNMKSKRYENALVNYQYNINIIDSGGKILFNSIKNRLNIAIEKNINNVSNSELFYNKLIENVKYYFNNDYVFENIMMIKNNKLLYSIIPKNKINLSVYQNIDSNIFVDLSNLDKIVYKYQVYTDENLLFDVIFIMDDDLLFNAFFKWYFSNISNNNFAAIIHNKIIYNNNVFTKKIDKIMNNINNEKYIFWIDDFFNDDGFFICHTFSIDKVNAYYGFIIPKHVLYSGISQFITIVFLIEFIGLLILMLGVYYAIFYWLKKPIKNIYDIIGTVDLDSVNDTINQIKNISINVNNYMEEIDKFVDKIRTIEEKFENTYNKITLKIENMENIFKMRSK